MRNVRNTAAAVAAAVFAWPLSLAAQEALTPAEVLRFGTAVAPAIVQQVWLSREMTVRGTYNASYATGVVTNTGTVTRTPAGQFSYDPSPADRLVVVLPNATHEIEVLDAVGNPQAATAEAFLGSNHDLHYVYRLPDVAELTVRTNKIGVAFATQVDGWFVHEDVRYGVDLRAEGGNMFENSGRSGSQTRTEYALTGTLTGPGATLTVDESHAFLIITHGGDAVSQSRDLSANVVVAGKDTYRWVDAEVVKVFRSYGAGMRPVFDAENQWKVAGRVTRNGESYGTYKIDAQRFGVTGKREYQGNIVINIVTPDGPYELQAFRGQ